MPCDKEFINEETEPGDSNNKLRLLNCELRPLSRPDGSAFLTQGETAVIASMYGPVEVRMSNLKIYNASVEVTYRPKSGLPTVKDRFQESIIKSTCKTALLTALHPRTAITIQVQEVENRCGLEACAVNAACLALLDGGISMKFTVAAVHSIIDKNNKLILDPNYREAIDALASFTFVFESVDKKLVTVNTNGKFNLEQYKTAVELSKSASDIIFRFYKKIITKSLNNNTLIKNVD